MSIEHAPGCLKTVILIFMKRNKFLLVDNYVNNSFEASAVQLHEAEKNDFLFFFPFSKLPIKRLITFID